MADTELNTLTSHDDPDVHRRARLVKDTLDVGPSEAARMHGVSRQTASKWTAIYETGGSAELLRRARRRATPESTEHAILTAGLWMSSTKWSTRSLAAALGVTQSRVARTWEPFRTGSAAADQFLASTDSSPIEIIGLLSTAAGTALVLRSSRDSDARSTARTPSPETLRVLRTGLTTALIDRADSPDTESATLEFWRSVADWNDERSTLFAAVIGQVAVPDSVTALVCATTAEWLSLFVVFPRCRIHNDPTALARLEHDAREWARDPRQAFAWTPHGDDERAHHRESTRAKASRPTPEQVLADEIVSTIRDAIRGGKLAGGDHVTERYLARELHTTRRQVHSAMRVLESEGLFTVTSGHSAVIPVPTVNDITETYAARSALGALVVRAAAQWSPQTRDAVDRSLDGLRDCAAANDVWRSGEEDLVFQNALATASGLVRIAPMLQLLADHLRMFILVMGLDYAYPVDKALIESQSIFDAVDARDPDKAVDLWRRKMASSSKYMVQQFHAISRQRRARPHGQRA